MTLEIVLLTALLHTSPPDEPLLPEAALFVEVMAPTVYAVALNAELLDPRERAGNAEPRLNGAHLFGLLLERWLEAQKLPMLGEFPVIPRPMLITMRDLNRKYREWLVQRLEIDLVHADIIGEAICETDAICLVLDALKDATDPTYYVMVRRRALAAVRRAIGDESFYLGVIPAFIPMRHIRRE